MHPPTLVFVESNTTGTGRQFAARASALGYRPLLLSRDPGRYSFVREDGLACIALDTRSLSAVLGACRSLGSGLAGIATSSEYAVPMVAAVAGRLSLPGLDPDAAARVRDKAHQRERLRVAGLEEVKVALCANPADLDQAARSVGFPAVVKPPGASGSIGVRLVTNKSELQRAAAAAMAVSETGQVLVEELLPGREFSAEMFDGRVIALVAKHLTAPPVFVEIGHDFPARIDSDMEIRLTRFARQAAQTLGLTGGPAHIELRDDGFRTRLVEANPRLAGGLIPRLIELATNQDMIEATIRWAVGRPADLQRDATRAASIRFLIAERSGRIARLNVEPALRTSGVAEAVAYRQPGDRVAVSGDFTDRVGHVIATDSVCAAEAAERGRAKVELFMEPEAVCA